MFEILLQHPDFIAINKPAGVSVHRDSGTHGLTERLAAQLGVPRVWLVHRLDKATSGVLLLALNAEAAAELSSAFAERLAEKTYWALSDGKPAKKQGRIKGGMAKSRRGAWKLTRGSENLAVTDFTSRSLAPKLRLFELKPHTGRTHQLRVALKSLGSPILGDTLYGGSPATRLFLHAAQLSFPYRGERYTVAAPADESWPPLNTANDAV